MIAPRRPAPAGGAAPRGAAPASGGGPPGGGPPWRGPPGGGPSGRGAAAAGGPGARGRPAGGRPAGDRPGGGRAERSAATELRGPELSCSASVRRRLARCAVRRPSRGGRPPGYVPTAAPAARHLIRSPRAPRCRPRRAAGGDADHHPGPAGYGWSGPRPHRWAKEEIVSDVLALLDVLAVESTARADDGARRSLPKRSRLPAAGSFRGV